MYFDIESRMELVESRVDTLFAAVAQEISRRRGRIVAMSGNLLLFSAPFWRANGLLYFVVQQLPLGVSHGVLDVIREKSKTVVRWRVSLLWLRVCITLIVLLLTSAVFAPGAGDAAMLYILLSVSILAGAVIYITAIIETRRFFRTMLVNIEKGIRPMDKS